MFDCDFYIDLFSHAFKEKLPHGIELKDLDQQSATRTLDLINAHLKKHSLNPKDFDHYAPAQYLARNIEEIWEKASSKTKDRFKKLFEHLNGLLRDSD